MVGRDMPPIFYSWKLWLKTKTISAIYINMQNIPQGLTSLTTLKIHSTNEQFTENKCTDLWMCEISRN